MYHQEIQADLSGVIHKILLADANLSNNVQETPFDLNDE